MMFPAKVFGQSASSAPESRLLTERNVYFQKVAQLLDPPVDTESGVALRIEHFLTDKDLNCF